MDPRVRDAVAGLLESAQWPEREANRRAALAADGDYWRRLAPDLPIESGDPPPDLAESPGVRGAIEQLREDGYFQLPTVVPADTLARLNWAIDAVKADGWPAVFAWVYDPLWTCARAPAIVRVVESRLGVGCAQLPHVFVHIVPSAAGASGFSPHFDGFVQGRLSVWLALTDATLENGCMHLVPTHALPVPFRASTLSTVDTVSVEDAFRALQATRALPARAGSALGWGFDVLHWGGPCVTPGVARRALSMEFLPVDDPPGVDDTPLIALDGPLPAFVHRLRMIAAAIRTYAPFDPSLARYQGLAKRLVG
jgi:hypothetical protein